MNDAGNAQGVSRPLTGRHFEVAQTLAAVMFGVYTISWLEQLGELINRSIEDHKLLDPDGKLTIERQVHDLLLYLVDTHGYFPILITGLYGVVVYTGLVVLWWWYAFFIPGVGVISGRSAILDYLLMLVVGFGYRYWADIPLFTALFCVATLILAMRFFLLASRLTSQSSRAVHISAWSAFLCSVVSFAITAVGFGASMATARELNHGYTELSKMWEDLANYVAPAMIGLSAIVTGICSHLCRNEDWVK